MADSWSRAPDQIQMYPDGDTITQLLASYAEVLRLVTRSSPRTEQIMSADKYLRRFSRQMEASIYKFPKFSKLQELQKLITTIASN